MSPRTRGGILRPRLKSGAFVRPLNFTVRRPWRAIVTTDVVTSTRLRWGATLAGLLVVAGCCVSRGRTANAAEAAAPSSIGIADLSSLIGSALAQSGLTVHSQSNQTYWTISSGPRRMWVRIDPQPLSITIAWSASDDNMLASKVQRAIGQEFAARYHAALQFKETPCGWFGP